MAFEIQEINGKLFKITTIPIDKYNTRRVHTPLTEAEYEKITSAVSKAHQEELGTLEKFKGSKMLPKKEEIDERDERAPEPVRGKSIGIKGDTFPSKKFRVQSEE